MEEVTNLFLFGSWLDDRTDALLKLNQAVSVSLPGCNVIHCRLHIVSSALILLCQHLSHHSFICLKTKMRAELLARVLLSHLQPRTTLVNKEMEPKRRFILPVPVL